MLTQHIISTRTTFIIQATTSGPGSVSCLAMTSETIPKSSEYVLQFGKKVAVNNVGNITLPVYPDTLYNIYCVISDSNGQITSYSSMLANAKQKKTNCCRRLYVDLKTIRFPSGKSSENAVAITLDAPPTSVLTLSLSAQSRPDNAIVVQDIFFPNNLPLSTTSWSISTQVSLRSTVPGEYQIIAEITDYSAYEIVFRNSPNFTVYSSVTEPPVPTVLSAKFQNDGRAVVVSFDSPTNGFSQDREFNCSNLLRFSGSLTSKCYFSDLSTLLIYPSPESEVVVGSSLQVISNNLRAQCTVSASVCSSWASVSSIPFFVSAPNSPRSPEVKLRAPQEIDECSRALFDFSGSSGSGGRRWSSLNVSIITDDPTSSTTADIKTFFESQYDVNDIPLGAPAGLFRPGYFYSLSFSLCNFLGSCSEAIHSLQVSLSKLPSLSLLNQRQFSLPASSSLTLGVQGYTIQCNGAKNFSNFDYRWSVFTDGVAVSTIKSLARSENRFVLNPNTLVIGSLYEFKVTVREKTSGRSITDSYFVTVLPSPLVATIAGPTQSTIQLGGSLTLDASQSYDPDQPKIKDHLNVSWSCYTQLPTLSFSCGLNLIPGAFGFIILSTNTNALMGDQFVVTFKLLDNTRQVSTSVYVTVISPTDPVISVARSNSISNSKWNPASDLVLEGKVLSPSNGVAHWSISGLSIDPNVNKTALTRSILPGINTFNLVLRGGKIPISESPYLISLTMSGFSASSSISISMNVPPRPGIFRVRPAVGIALATEFNFLANRWNDTDIPLTFQFAYTSGGRLQVIQSRSEVNFVSSFLPTGIERENRTIYCGTYIYDSLDASSFSSFPVRVNGNFSSSLSLGETISFRLEEVEGNMEATRQIISVGGSLLNVRNCSASPICSQLFRDECQYTDHTCGPCLSNYYGSEGDGNSLCIPIGAPSRNVPCSSNTECSPWQICSPDLICEPKPKECNVECSEHGVCEFRNSDSGESLDSCLYDDLSCDAVCICSNGWYGHSCSVSENEYNTYIQAQSKLLQSLMKVMASDEATSELLGAWISSLSTLSQPKADVSPSMASLVAEMTSSILSFSPSATNLVDLMTSIEKLFLSPPISRRLSAGIENSLSLLKETSSVLSENMVVGEIPYETTKETFRTSSQRILLKEKYIYTLFQSDAEKVMQTPITQCEIATSSEEHLDRGLSVISTKSRYFQGENISSNPLSISLTGNADSIICYLPNNTPKQYVDLQYPEMLSVNCTPGDYGTYTKNCLGLHGNISISVSCNGTLAHISHQCPQIQTFPDCVVSGDSNLQCTRVSYNSTFTVCSCSRLLDRKLSAILSDSNVALQVHLTPNSLTFLL